MENFDELMRQKYDNDDPAGRFEFREEYWEQARALIEADEARRKRRRMLLWYCFAGLLMLSAGIGWWRYSAGNHTLEAQKNELDKGGDNLSGIGSNVKIKSNEIANQANNQTENLLNTTTKPNEEATINSSSNPNRASQRLSGAKNDPSTSNRLNTNTKNTAKGQQPKGLNTQRAPAAAGKTPITTNSIPFDPNVETGTNPSNSSLAKLLEQLFPLPLPFEVERSSAKLKKQRSQAAVSPKADQIKPHNAKRMALGIAAAAVAYEASPDKRWLGFSGGLYAAYRVKENWSVSLGPSLRYQPGFWLDSSFLELNEQRKYSFGFKSTLSERRSVGLLSLEIPIAVQWQRHLLALEAGVAPGTLLYALDRYKQSEESSLETRKTTRHRLEQGDIKPYGLVYANFFAGVDWRLTQQLRLSLRGNYRLGDLAKATAENAAVPGGANLELGMRWKLF